MPFPLTLTPVGDRMIRAERVFAAPPAKLWQALTDPALVLKWQGMPSHPMLEVEIDLRIGGKWRYVWGTPSGNRMVAFGSYLDLAVPTRIVHTEAFEEDWTDGPTTCTTTLSAVEAGTRLVMDILYTGPKGRDMAMNSGMEEGMTVSYNQLEEMLTP